jgi:hypothetical protein
MDLHAITDGGSMHLHARVILSLFLLTSCSGFSQNRVLLCTAQCQYIGDNPSLYIVGLVLTLTKPRA